MIKTIVIATDGSDQAEKADVIVCGSRGLSDFKGVIAGSVSHKLSNLAPVTVVSVR